MTLDLEEAIWAVGLAAFEGGVRSPTHNAAEIELKVAIEAEFAKRIATAPSVDEALVAFGDAEVSHAHHLSSRSDAARVAAGDALRTAIATHVESEVARRLAIAPGVEAALADLLGQVGCAAHHRDKMADALRAAIAADRERAVEGMRPVLSQADAERLVNDADPTRVMGISVADCLAKVDAARTALLRALGVEA